MYPNLGVIDAYATVRKRRPAVGDPLLRRARRATAARRRRSAPYRIEVIEPLQQLRLVCDGDDHGLGFDLTWEGSFPAVDGAAPRHAHRRTGRSSTPARFAQVGTWEGVLSVGGEEIAVDPGSWVGTRDRSWGIRPVGEAEPPGRNADEPLEGFWWLYVPLRFDDFAVIVIVQEMPDGFRTLNDATRIWSDGRGRAARLAARSRSTTGPAPAIPSGAMLHLTDARRQAVRRSRSRRSAPWRCTSAPGYGGDPDWAHGQWRGRDFVEGAVVRPHRSRHRRPASRSA